MNSKSEFKSMSSTDEVTRLLNEMSAGTESSPERLLEFVYDDLRRLAGSYMQNERSDHTLQATALVHEAYMRLVDWKNVSWQNRAHFFSVAANTQFRVPRVLKYFSLTHRPPLFGCLLAAHRHSFDQILASTRAKVFLATTWLW